MPTAALHPWWRVEWASGDTTAPVLTITSGPTRTRISRVAGGSVDASTVTFTANEAVTQWQARLVPSSSSPQTAGTLIESGGAVAQGNAVTVTVTDDELVAAGATEGALIIKLFGRDAAGNWSA